MNYLVTYAILGAVAMLLCRAERRRFERQFCRDYQAGVAGGGRDKLDALIEATRDRPHESYAWGPDAGQPIGYLPAEADDFDRWEDEMAEGSQR